MNNESVQHSNISEDEMGQLHSIHFSENALAALRASMPSGASAEECADCGEEIPLQRRIAAKGCQRCITCQTLLEMK